MPKRICRAPGCGQIEVDGGYCQAHQERRAVDGKERYQRKWKSRPWVKLYYSPRWKKLSRAKLQANPVCENCGKDIADEVHHLKPHRGDPVLFFAWENLQSLCKSCHSRETAREKAERAQGGG